jgi:hypothetical protein
VFDWKNVLLQSVPLLTTHICAENSLPAPFGVTDKVEPVAASIKYVSVRTVGLPGLPALLRSSVTLKVPKPSMFFDPATVLVVLLALPPLDETSWDVARSTVPLTLTLAALVSMSKKPGLAVNVQSRPPLTELQLEVKSAAVTGTASAAAGSRTQKPTAARNVSRGTDFITHSL